MDPLELGHLCRPAIKKMVLRIPHMRCAVLCTPDGYNVCSVGITDQQVGKMAALSSSLLSIGDATVASLAQADAPPRSLDVVTMEANGLQIVGTKIKGTHGPLVLLTCAKAPLGVLLMNIKATAAELEKLI